MKHIINFPSQIFELLNNYERDNVLQFLMNAFAQCNFSLVILKDFVILEANARETFKREKGP